MSQFPPGPPRSQPLDNPPPIEYQATAPAAWPGYIAWAIILLAVAFLIISNVAPKLRGRKPSTAGAETQLVLSAKYGIGLRELPLPKTPPAAVLEQLDKLARTPEQQLQSATVAAELEGAEAAIKRIGSIDRSTLSPEWQQTSDDLLMIYTSGPNALDAARQQQLTKRLGFFGKLALSYKQPDASPLRQQVLSQSRNVALALLIGVGIGGLLALAGLVLLIIAIVLLSTRSLRLRYQPAPWAGTVYVEMFAVYLISYIGLSLVISLLTHGEPSLGVNWLLIAVLPIAFAWALFRGQSWEQIRQAVGWHSGQGVHIEIPMGIAGYIAGLPVIIVGFLITLVLMRFSSVTPSHPIQNIPLDSATNVLLLYSIASIFAPFVEETMFRGALFSHMRRRWNWPISAAVVALLFAAIHPQGWTTIPVLGSIAIVLAALREWRGSIISCMVAHALNNAMVVTLLVLVK